MLGSRLRVWTKSRLLQCCINVHVSVQSGQSMDNKLKNIYIYIGGCRLPLIRAGMGSLDPFLQTVSFIWSLRNTMKTGIGWILNALDKDWKKVDVADDRVGRDVVGDRGGRDVADDDE